MLQFIVTGRFDKPLHVSFDDVTADAAAVSSQDDQQIITEVDLFDDMLTKYPGNFADANFRH